MSLLTVVIPVRNGGSPDITTRSLERQTFKDFDVVVQHDEGNGANWARNKGAANVTTKYILFSDDDIRWNPRSMECLVRAMEENPGCDFAYGSYEMDGVLQCDKPFDAAALRKQNYISTMSIIRTDKFPLFDEGIKRLQDWDLFLSLVENGSSGVYIGRVIFSTEKGDGITYGEDGVPYEEAIMAVRTKHGIA